MRRNLDLHLGPSTSLSAPSATDELHRSAFTGGAGALSEPKRKSNRLLYLAAFLWALEIFLIQEHTFHRGYPPNFTPLNIFGARLGRFGLDFSFALAVLALVPRRLVFLPLLLWQVWSATILSYYEYFERPLSLQTVKSSFGEGAAVAGVGLELLGGKLVFALTVAFLLKSTLAFAARSASVRIWKTGLFAIVAWGLLSAVILHFHPFRLLKTTFNFEKAAAAYGYFWTWVGEEIYLGDELLERAIEAARTRTSNQLADEVPPPPADRVVIIQVESLDDSIVGHVVEGVTIVPFLTSLQETSMHYKVRAIHDNGSADADFSMLTGLHPSPDVITYRLLNYPYADTLPKIFSRAGYHTESIHGLYGSFFERRVVFEGPMGFDDVIFEEELVKDYGLVPGRWGVRDREMMRVAADRLLAHEGKIFQFIITLSSHSPFDFIDPEDEEIAPGAEHRRWRYFNSIRYADRALQDFYERVPEGTLLVIYGDHESLTRSQPRDAEGKKIEYVPYFIHQKGKVLRSSNPERARGGGLTQLDLVTFIRNYALSLLESATADAG